MKGIAKLTKLYIITPLSKRELLYLPEYIPSGIAIRYVNVKVNNDSHNVFTALAPINFQQAFYRYKDCPNSPFVMILVTQSLYCSGIGLFKPCFSLNCSITSGSISGVIKPVKGSPGII